MIFYFDCSSYCVSHIVCLINLRNPQTSALIVCRIFDTMWLEYLRTIFFFVVGHRKGRRLWLKIIHKISFILPGTEYDFIITIIKTWRKDVFGIVCWISIVCLNLCYMCINLPLIHGDCHSCEWLDMGLIFCLIGIPNPRAQVRWVSCMLNFVYHANWLIRAQAYSSSLALSL